MTDDPRELKKHLIMARAAIDALEQTNALLHQNAEQNSAAHMAKDLECTELRQRIAAVRAEMSTWTDRMPSGYIRDYSDCQMDILRVLGDHE